MTHFAGKLISCTLSMVSESNIYYPRDLSSLALEVGSMTDAMGNTGAFFSPQSV